ncbi:MAG: hypothetical protein ACP5F3_07365 [Candidatus Syntrophosphaera sp.]
MRIALMIGSIRFLVLLALTLLFILAAITGCGKERPEPQAAPESPAEQDTLDDSLPEKILSLQDAIEAYESGAAGERLEQAIALFRQHSYGNDPQAQYYLGKAHHEGAGVQQSNLEAYYWWTVAARNGYIAAMDAVEDADRKFSQEDLEEIQNRADDWEEHVRVTPEID